MNLIEIANDPRAKAGKHFRPVQWNHSYLYFDKDHNLCSSDGAYFPISALNICSEFEFLDDKPKSKHELIQQYARELISDVTNSWQKNRINKIIDLCEEMKNES